LPGTVDFCEYTEAALDELRISIDVKLDGKHRSDPWTACDEDFRYVNRRIVNLKKRIYESANGLIGIVEAQKSVEAAIASTKATNASTVATRVSLSEAKAVRNLTIIGILFLPLGFTAGRLSLGQDFGPEQPRFWVYWAISIPLICVAFVSLYFAKGFSVFEPP
jgi:hypothetical protein